MNAATPEEAFNYCLENPDNLTIEQLLDKFPAYREELQSLLSFERRVAEALPQPMPPTSRAALKQKLISSLAEQQAAKPYSAEETTRGERTARPARIQRGGSWLRRTMWALTLVTLVALFGYLASSALPNSPLYGAKLTTENMLLGFATAPADVARGHLRIANQRLYELRTVQLSGDLAQAGPAVDSYSNHLIISEGVWKGLAGSEHTALTKLLYVSSVAGRRTFEGFGGTVGQLPASLRAAITQSLEELQTLDATAGEELEASGLDLDRLLQEAEGAISPLLTPVPGAAIATPPPTRTPTVVPSPVPSPVPCLDAYEDDGVPAQARRIAPGETQRHLFCPAADADWLIFFADAGKGYAFETSQLSADANPYMYLFAADARTILERIGDAPDARGPARIAFYPKSAGWYYIQVKNHGDVGTPGAGYSITLSLVATATPTPAP